MNRKISKSALLLLGVLSAGGIANAEELLGSYEWKYKVFIGFSHGQSRTEIFDERHLSVSAKRVDTKNIEVTSIDLSDPDAQTETSLEPYEGSAWDQKKNSDVLTHCADSGGTLVEYKSEGLGSLPACYKVVRDGDISETWEGNVPGTIMRGVKKSERTGQVLFEMEVVKLVKP